MRETDTSIELLFHEQISTLLIVGNLNPSPQHISYLQEKLHVRVIVVESPSQESFLEYVRDADYIFACNFNLTPFLSHLVHVKLIVLAETGVVCLDATKACELGIQFTNLTQYSSAAVAEYVVHCCLESQRPWQKVFEKTSRHSREGKDGKSLSTKTVGLVGFGTIGKLVAESLRPLVHKILCTSRSPLRHPFVKWVTIEEIFSDSDIVIICCSKNESSLGLINRSLLSLVKHNGVLISISPNDVFSLPDLHDFASNRTDAALWLDLDVGKDYEVLSEFPHIQISPHLAFFTSDTLERRVTECIDKLEAFITHGRHHPHPAGSPSLPIQFEGTFEGDWCETEEEKVLRIASSFYQSASLFAAIELGIFNTLRSNTLSAHDLARKLNVDEKVLTGLLLSLSGSGLLRRSPGKFEILPEFLPVLVEGAPRYCGHTMTALKNKVYPAWLSLATTVSTGHSAHILQQQRSKNPEDAAFCTKGSDSQSRSIVDRVLPHISLPPHASLLDVGCGSAVITRHLLHRYADSRAVLLDVQLVLDFTRDTYLAPEGLVERCSFLPGDFHATIPSDQQFDLVILSNVLHLGNEADVRDLFSKVAQSLSPNGKIVLVGFFLPDREPYDFLVPHFSLSCQILTARGRCYSHSELDRFLDECNLKRQKTLFLTRYVDVVMISRKTCNTQGTL